MVSSHRKAYSYEKRLCKRLELVRVIDQSEGDCDGVGECICAEMFQKPIPKYLKEKIEQAIVAVARRGWKHLPICIWREKHKEDGEALVIIRLKDFEEWFGR